MEHCDLLLMLGTDFPYRPFYPENARVIQVDVRGEHIGRRVHVDIGLVGTVRDTIATLLPRLDNGRDATHLARMQSHYRRTRERLDALAETHDDDAVFLADVGTPTLWAARYLRLHGRRRLVGSFNHGSMANALPQAIGVQASHPGRQVVTLSGDGGLSMTYATDLDNPSFAEVARAVGLHGVRVEDPSELGDALRAAFAHDGPAVIEVMTLRQELSIPPKITMEQAKGFTLWATRSVLSGRGDEVLEIARTNLRELALE